MATAFATSFMFLLIMVLPMIAGIALIIMSRKRGKGFPACGQCGYDVTGTLGTSNARCPECGGDFGVVGILPPITKARPWPMAAGIVLIALPLTCVGASVFFARASFSRATQAAQAAARQAAVAQQQAMLASQPADPALVAGFRANVAGMTVADASARLSAITHELAQRQADQSLDNQIAGALRAEFEALSQHLSDQPPLSPPKP